MDNFSQYSEITLLKFVDYYTAVCLEYLKSILGEMVSAFFFSIVILLTDALARKKEKNLHSIISKNIFNLQRKTKQRFSSADISRW